MDPVWRFSSSEEKKKKKKKPNSYNKRNKS